MAALGPGTAGYTLTTQGAAANPTWTVPFNPIGTSRVTRNSAIEIQLGVGVIPLQVSSVWVTRAVTAAVTISNAGLVANTTYFVYAFDSAGTTTLELSTTGHVTNTSFGVETKSADATRTLVGMIRTEGSTPGQFVDSIGQRFVISYYARRGIGGQSRFTTDRSTSSTTFVEINTEIRIEFLTWSDEAVLVGIAGYHVNNTASSAVFSAIDFDGGAIEEASTLAQTPATATYTAFGLSLAKSGLSEGYHYVTLFGAVNGVTTGTWGGGTANSKNGPTFSTALIRG